MKGELAIPVQQLREKPEANSGLVGRANLQVGSRSIRIRTTKDFPPTDGWSIHKGKVIELRRKRGDFIGRTGAEAGVGDGRNLLRAGIHEAQKGDTSFTGIDVDAWRAALAHENLLTAGVPEDKLSILVGGAINHLNALEGKQTGWNFACLPQAPASETVTHADGIDTQIDSLDGSSGLQVGARTVDEYGLSLNAAYLRALRKKVDEKDGDVLVTLSGRIPSDVRTELFSATGWEIKEIFGTKEPVLQDSDTGVAYVAKYAEELSSAKGDGFFEQTKEGLYVPLSPGEAEERRQNAHVTSAPLNVHHHVYEYLAFPKKSKKGPLTIYEI